MKLITAILQPSIVDELREELAKIDVAGITSTNVRGFGRQKGFTELYRGNEYQVDFIEKIKLEIAVSESYYEKTIETIKRVAWTGNIGDGKIFVTNLESVIRIRTGEENNDAL